MSDPIVTVQQGQIKGLKCTNYLGEEILGFLGIPYAKAPIGQLRFKPPAEPEPWSGIRDGTVEGPQCPSKHVLFLYVCGSEDNCLNLNIYTRTLPSEFSKPKPVMVWIHGGAFMYGSNKSDFYGPKALMLEDIVFVAINYRLGILGFLSLEDQKLDVPGNMGLKDMVAALKWIQRNIANFNGDPNNVTIFGESAGSAAVHYLILSPLCKGLFHKAILQSGCVLNCWARGSVNGKKIAKQLNYNDTNNEKTLLDYLRDLPAYKLVKAQFAVYDPLCVDYQRPFGPVIEHQSPEAFLCEDPVVLMKTGRFEKCPIIIGYNSNEGIFFELIRKMHSTIGFCNNYETEIPYELNLIKGSDESKEIAKKIQNFYTELVPLIHRRPSNERTLAIKMDTNFAYGIYRTINYMKWWQTDEPIYFYNFAAETTLNYMKQICSAKQIYILAGIYFVMSKCPDGSLIRDYLFKLSRSLPRDEFQGVCHADDLGYLFNTYVVASNFNQNSSEFLLIKRMVRMWTNFAAYGQPTSANDDDLPDWKAIESDTNYCLEIGTEQMHLKQDPIKERMQFWDGIYAQFTAN